MTHVSNHMLDRLMRLSARGTAALLLALTLATAMIGVTAVVTPTAALAAQYGQAFCQNADGSTAPTDGWSPSNNGAYTFTDNACGSGSGLNTAWATDIAHDFGAGAWWTYTAPANTTIAGISGARVSAAGGDQPYGTPVTALTADGATIDNCYRPDCAGQSGQINFAIPSASQLSIGIVCGGGPGGQCPAGSTTSNSIRRGTITLNDNNSPVFSATPSGTLLSEKTTVRTRTLNYSATDQGGGVLRQILYEGSNALQSGVVNDNNGRCSKPFQVRVPCALNTSGSITYDTAALPDGNHDLSLEIRDATDVNKATYGPFTILVDNVPPILTGTTEVTGKAEQGEQLTCVSPDVNGQTPVTSYAWARQNSDGSGRTVISGATDVRYTLTVADKGYKITCVLSAKDVGGTSSRESSLTSGPFANGATVGAGKGPQPNGPATLTATGNGTFSEPHPGTVLTINTPAFTGNSPTFVYSWLRCDSAATPASCVTIQGQSGTTYTLTDLDKDHRIVGQVVATDNTGSTTSQSAATGLVTNAPKSGTTVTSDPATPVAGSNGSNGSGGAAGAGGAGGAGGSSSSSSSSVDLKSGEPNGNHACQDARLVTRFDKGSTTKVRMGRSATLRGTLICVTTKLPITGASIALSAKRLGGNPSVGAGTVTTDAQGRFTRVLAKGPGRQVRLSYVAFGGRAEAATSTATMLVRGKVSLARIARTVHRGQRIRFHGKLYGGFIPKGLQLILEARNGKKWQAFGAPITVKAGGRYSYTFRCVCQIPGQHFMFRVRIPKATRLPYVPVTSRSRRIRVG